MDATNIIAAITDQFAADTDDDTTDQIGPISYARVPLVLLRGALFCAMPKDAHGIRDGIHLMRTGDNTVRIQATDGHRLFVAHHASGEPLPDWLEGAGIIIDGTGLKARLALMGDDYSKVRIGFATNAPWIELADANESVIFRVNHQEGDRFPDTDGLIARLAGNFDGRRKGEPLEGTTYQGQYLKEVAGLANVLGAKSATMLTGGDTTKPTVITFADQPESLLILQPMTNRLSPVSARTAEILAPALKGTLAALRAHATRTQKALEKARGGKAQELAARLAEYEARIRAITNPPALEAPEPEAETEEEADDAPAASDPATGADDAGGEPDHTIH